jgi:hypothetical protein
MSVFAWRRLADRGLRSVGDAALAPLSIVDCGMRLRNQWKKSEGKRRKGKSERVKKLSNSGMGAAFCYPGQLCYLRFRDRRTSPVQRSLIAPVGLVGGLTGAFLSRCARRPIPDQPHVIEATNRHRSKCWVAHPAKDYLDGSVPRQASDAIST